MIIRILLLVLFLVVNASAMNPAFLGVVTSGTSEDYTDITFWWRAEAADFSGTNSSTGTCTGSGTGEDCSAGDDTGTIGSSAAINAAAARYGTNGLDIPGDWDTMKFDVSVNDILDDDESRIGFWIRIVTWADAGIFLAIRDVGSDIDEQILLQFAGESSSDIEFMFRWKDHGVYKTNLESDGFSAVENTWYFLEFAWKSSTNYREIFINGSSYGSSNATIASFTDDVGEINLGEFSGSGTDFHMDNIMISNDSTRDFDALKTLTSFPGN